VHLEENFAKNVVPSLNTDKAASIASMERVRGLTAKYNAKLFINHDKSQADTLKLIPISTIERRRCVSGPPGAEYERTMFNDRGARRQPL
jgi:hypothetical protein